MKRIALIAFVACSSKTEEPERKPPPPKKRAELDLGAEPPGYEINKVSFLPLGSMDGPVPGNYSVSWEATRDGKPVKIPAHVKCRANGYNLVKLHSDANPTSTGFYPDPFDAVAEACEVRWVDGETVIARACFRNDELVNGACPDGTFPRPELPYKMAIDFKPVPSPKRYQTQIAPIVMNGPTVQISALTTLGERLGGRALRTKLRCFDGTTIGTGETSDDPVGLGKLEAGESVYGWEWLILGDAKLQAMKTLERCEIELHAGEQLLGTFCIAGNGETVAGACEPALGKR